MPCQGLRLTAAVSVVRRDFSVTLDNPRVALTELEASADGKTLLVRAVSGAFAEWCAS